MSTQRTLRRRIAAKKQLQVQRIDLVAEHKRQLDESVEKAALEIQNLEAQLTIGVAQ